MDDRRYPFGLSYVCIEDRLLDHIECNPELQLGQELGRVMKVSDQQEIPGEGC